MLAKTMLLKMFEYNHFINNRLLELAANVTPEQWDAPQDFGQRSIHETFFHLLVVQEEWRWLCETGQPIWNYRAISDYPDAASLLAFSDMEYAATRKYVENASEEMLTASIFAEMPQGVELSTVIWGMLIHSLYHSTQHRSEVAAMLTKYGQSPGDIDIIGHFW